MKILSTLYAALAGFVALAAGPAAAQTFTGPRIEGTVGWDQLRYDLGSAAESTTTKTTKERRSDLGYGVTVGYDRQVTPTLIVGVEGGVTFSQGDYTSNGFPVGDTVHVRRDLSAAARIGTRVGSNALLYGKVGYSNLQLGVDTVQGGFDPAAGFGGVIGAGPGATATTTYGRRNYDGVLLGVGAEVGLTANTYLKTEYRYTDYQDGVARQNVLTGFGIRF